MFTRNTPIILKGMLNAIVAFVLLLGILYKVFVDQQFLKVDYAVLQWMQVQQHSILLNSFSKVSFLGNRYFIVSIVILSAAIYFYFKKYIEAACLFSGTIITGASVYLFKVLIERPGPHNGRFLESSWLFPNGNWAFPSGHTTMTSFVYIFLAYLALRQVENNKYHIAVLTGAFILSITMGISRLYDNVHWLSDVLAGIALSWLYLSIFISTYEIMKLKVSNIQKLSLK